MTLPNRAQVPPCNGPGMSDLIREFGRLDLPDYSACAPLFFPLTVLIVSSVNTFWVSQGSPNDAL